MKSVFISIVLASLIQLQSVAQLSSAQVISIGDGDTITVNQNGQKVRVRLGCIDAPEMKQTPYGQAARGLLRSLLPVGTQITLREINRDRYGRTVAEVFKGQDSVNLAMVANGQAVIYPQYFKGCQSSQTAYQQAQSQAKQQRLGFWNQDNPQMPWEFRRNRRSQ